MSIIKRYYFLETTYSLALSFTRATFVIFFLSHKLSFLEISLIFSMFNITVIAAEPLTASYAELFGYKKSILAGAFIKCIAAIIFFMGTSFSTFMLAEIISALGLTLISGCIMGHTVDALNASNCKKNLYEVIATCKRYKYCALLAGGVSGAYMADFNTALPWAANGFVFFCLLVSTVLTLPAKQIASKQEKKSNSFGNIFYAYKAIFSDHCLFIIIFTSFLTAFSLASIKLFWLPSIKTDFNTSNIFIGWIWAGIAFAGLIGSSILKPYIQKFTYKLDGIILLSLASAFFLLIMIITTGTWWTIVFYFLFETGKPLYSIIKSDLINYQIQNKGRATVLSFHSLMVKLGTILGLTFFGYLSLYINTKQVWLLCTVIFAINTIFYMIVQLWMRKNPNKKQFLYVHPIAAKAHGTE